MHHETLLPATAKVLKQLANVSSLQQFYLSGGTALALQLGHRESEDLDFFSSKVFVPLKLQTELATIGSLQSVELAEGTLNCFMDRVKLQFLHYPYPLLEKELEWEGVKISSLIDIACTKVITISMRGSKKDFIDLHFLLEKYSLADLFLKIEQKYHGVQYNREHLLKSLLYFNDAEQQPMPRMHAAAEWKEIKAEIVQKVKSFPLF